MGAENPYLQPARFALPDAEAGVDPKVQELRELRKWSKAWSWCVHAERHGGHDPHYENPDDWIRYREGAVSLHPGAQTSLVEMQSPRSHALNAVKPSLRVAGYAGCRMVNASNNPSVPKAFIEFEDKRSDEPSPFYDTDRRTSLEELMKSPCW